MEEFKKPSRPFNVPENKPFYAIDIPNFNWKLWMIITNINDMPIDIREKGPFITTYDNIYALLPSEEKRIYLNPLGVYLGYMLAGEMPINLKKPTKEKVKKLLKDGQKMSEYGMNKIKKVKKDDKKMSECKMNKIALVRYIEYFKHKNI